MKTPGVIDGVIIAVVISLYTTAVSLVLGGIIAYTTLFNLVLCGSSLIYLAYLLKRSKAKAGRVVVIASWAVASLGCWFFEIPLSSQVLIQAGLIWLVRALYFHSSMLAATLDGALVSVGLAASAWALLNTGSLAGALWSFFLVQALFCWIPDLHRKQSGASDHNQHDQSPFQSAHRVALDAVRKLTQP